jgi:hypothetical protein
MNRKKIGIAMATLGLIAGYLYATPYITLFMLKRAIEAKSAKEVEKFIDFADVRDSLRSQLADYLQEQVAKDPDTAGFEGLATGIGTALGGSIIDTAIRPGNLQKWLNSSENKKRDTVLPLPSFHNLVSSPSLNSMGYQSVDTFALRLTNDAPLSSVVLERSNIVNWKIVAINLNPASISAAVDAGKAESQYSEPLASQKRAIKLRPETYISSSPTDDIVYIDDVQSWYYYCMGFPPSCPTKDPIYGGVYTRVSEGVIKLGSTYYCSSEVPDPNLPWKCTRAGLQRQDW